MYCRESTFVALLLKTNDHLHMMLPCKVMILLAVKRGFLVGHRSTMKLDKVT